MKGIVYKLSSFLNQVAGFILLALMTLVVTNVVMRLLGQPIKGTVEYVGFLTSISVGMSLAHCGAQNGHIAVSLFTDKLPLKTQKILDILVNTVVFLFLCLIVWRLWIYAMTLKRTGQIALTTGIVFYPFILAIAFGFVIYSLVVLVKLAGYLKREVKE